VALGEDGLEDPPGSEPVLPEESLGRLHLVGEALVLADSPDQREDGRHVGPGGRAEGDRTGDASRRGVPGPQPSRRRARSGAGCRDGSRPPTDGGSSISAGGRALRTWSFQWSSTILSPAFFIDIVTSAPSSACCKEV